MGLRAWDYRGIFPPREHFLGPPFNSRAELERRLLRWSSIGARAKFFLPEYEYERLDELIATPLSFCALILIFDFNLEKPATRPRGRCGKAGSSYMKDSIVRGETQRRKKEKEINKYYLR